MITEMTKDYLDETELNCFYGVVKKHSLSIVKGLGKEKNMTNNAHGIVFFIGAGFSKPALPKWVFN